MKLLLIENDKNLSTLILDYLEEKKIQCDWANNYCTAEDKIICHDYDCILLDIMLPDGNGLELLEKILKEKKESVVIITSAINTVNTKVDVLLKGADDYLVKPFHLSELYARIMASVRRKFYSGKDEIIFNEIKVDVLSKNVYVNENLVNLTKTEFEILLFFLTHKNHILSKVVIKEHVSENTSEIVDSCDSIYTHIKNLKRKLQKAGAKDYIKSVYGLGYKFSE